VVLTISIKLSGTSTGSSRCLAIGGSNMVTGVATDACIVGHGVVAAAAGSPRSRVAPGSDHRAPLSCWWRMMMMWHWLCCCCDRCCCCSCASSCCCCSAWCCCCCCCRCCCCCCSRLFWSPLPFWLKQLCCCSCCHWCCCCCWCCCWYCSCCCCCCHCSSPDAAGAGDDRRCCQRSPGYVCSSPHRRRSMRARPCPCVPDTGHPQRTGNHR